jgi:hypothetical protein
MGAQRASYVVRCSRIVVAAVVIQVVPLLAGSSASFVCCATIPRCFVAKLLQITLIYTICNIYYVHRKIILGTC